MKTIRLTRRRSRAQRPWRTLAAISAAVGLVLGSIVAGPAQAAEPTIHDEVLYANGDAGYACFRIPAVVRAVNGDLLAFAEGRVKDCGDDGDIDLVLRRSPDDGRTWSDIQIISRGNGETHGNPNPIVDQKTGRVALVSVHNGAADCSDGCQRMPYSQTSDDNGVTWSAAEKLTDATKPQWDFWYAAGPMHGIQLTRGDHAGRMIVAASFEYFEESGQHVYGTHLLYSDDAGLSWHIGAETSRNDGTVIAQETTAVELKNGDIYALARERGTDLGSRASAISSDGGNTWNTPFRMEPDLVMPDVQGSLLRFSATDTGAASDRILFSAPLHGSAREVMGIRSSTDEAKSFNGWPQAKVFWWGPTAYSDMVRLDGDEAALFYEAGVKIPYESIRFARFNEAFLDSPNGTPPGIPGPAEQGPSTKDASRAHNRAYVRGGAEVGPGKFGSSLVLDGVDDHVEVPFDSSIDVADKDFTMMTWMKYGEAKGSHALLWAYRTGTGTTPQVWLRAEPEKNRIIAMMGVDRFNISVQTSQSYNDDEWHHVVLQRVEGQIALSVDGQETVSAPVPPGSVTAGKEFGVQGIHVGQRVDDVNRFHGSLDEVRVYRRALSADEITKVRETNEMITTKLGLALSLESVR